LKGEYGPNAVHKPTVEGGDRTSREGVFKGEGWAGAKGVIILLNEIIRIKDHGYPLEGAKKD